jgi:hypothetical protein
MRHRREAGKHRPGRATRLVQTGNGVKVSAHVFCACVRELSLCAARLLKTYRVALSRFRQKRFRTVTPDIPRPCCSTRLALTFAQSSQSQRFWLRSVHESQRFCRCDGVTVVQVRHSAFLGRMFEPGLFNIRCGHLRMELIWRSVLGKGWGDVGECFGAFAMYFSNSKAYSSITSASSNTTAHALCRLLKHSQYSLLLSKYSC